MVLSFYLQKTWEFRRVSTWGEVQEVGGSVTHQRCHAARDSVLLGIPGDEVNDRSQQSSGFAQKKCSFDGPGWHKM